MTDLPFVKGHGTENDFILVPDLDDVVRLDPGQVAQWTDRRAGLGADGVIRVAHTVSADEDFVREQADVATFFMDYRNADGSLSQMCGNGIRVLAAYLQESGLEPDDEFAIATRSGVKHLRRTDSGYAVDMGPWRLTQPERAVADGFDTLVNVGELTPFSAISLDLGNPHTVVALPEGVDLESLRLETPPLLNPPAPEGSNVEFVRPLGPGHLRMRVHERGVGETRSCGTGVCAAALATSFWATGAVEDGDRWTVEVPGGVLQVRALPHQRVELAGPAVLVAQGVIRI